MMKGAITLEKERTPLVYPSTMIVWLIIVTIIMVFAGLTSALIVKKSDGSWLSFEVPTIFTLSTAVIIVSSAFLEIAQVLNKRGKKSATSIVLWLSLLLGIGFMATQFIGWTDLVDQNIYLGGANSNAAGSFVYVITGLHWAHMIAGVIYMVIVAVTIAFNEFDNPVRAVRNCATFWHFLGLLWLYLYIFLILNYN